MNTVKSIGAKFIEVPLKAQSLDPLEEIRIKIIEGIEIDISDVDINEGALLNYKGLHVILYIKDHRKYLDKTINGTSSYRFHISDCDKIQEMKSNQRLERYVVTQNTSGQFKVTGTINGRQKEVVAEIKVCKLCLKKINYKGYATKDMYLKNQIFDNFKILDFFSMYSSYFSELPLSTDNTKFAGYGPQWNEISYDFKNKIGWTCQKCNVNLSSVENRYLLHVHHINGNTSDNNPNNLISLCKDCHSKQFQHDHMFVKRSERRIINHLRNIQSTKNFNVISGTNINDWKSLEMIVDPALHNLLDLVKRHVKPKSFPVAGFELLKNNEVISEPVELAWVKEKIALMLKKDNDTVSAFTREGWSIFTPSEAMSQWFNS